MHDDRLITPEYVKWLQEYGASKDLIKFADRHAARYGAADVDAALARGLRWGMVFGAIAGFIFGLGLVPTL